MKTKKLISSALMGATVLASLGLVGCENDDIYKVDAPDDLQDRIDAIAEMKAQAAAAAGDTVNLDIAVLTVGNEDCSSGWNSVRSDAFEVPAGKKLVLQFINHSSGGSNWNNWNLCVANKDDQKAAENNMNDMLYFLLRADNWGWGGAIEKGFDASLKIADYGNDVVSWEEWLPQMEGAFVTMEIDHSPMGPTYVDVKMEGNQGVTFTETLVSEGTQKSNLYAWLVCDGSYFEMQRAYLIPSAIQEVEDQLPVSLSIDGAPLAVEIGDDNFWGMAYATVTFADGSSVVVDSADLTMVAIPDMAEVGKKNVVVSYNKTKQGAYCQAIVAIYEVEVIAPVVGINVIALPKVLNYNFYGEAPVKVSYDGLAVEAELSDGSKVNLELSALKLPQTVAAKAGKSEVEVVYEGTEILKTTFEVELTKVEGTLVGALDFSNGWWTTFSEDVTVAAGESKTIKMYVFSDNLEAWHSPCTILRSADPSVEYGVVRVDSWGWGSGYEGNEALVKENDWDFDVLKANVNGSYFEITVKNNGDDTADILYDVTLANGEKHYQNYKGFKVNSADLTTALVTEESYLVIVE